MSATPRPCEHTAYTCQHGTKFVPADTLDEVKAVLKHAKEALYNAPEVGDEYDQQHSDTHIRAILAIEAVLAKLEG